MPRYVYRCESCGEHFQIRHGMSEVQEECIKCSVHGMLRKVPQMPNIKKEHTGADSTTGTLTNNFIEQNRELLNEMKRDARSQTYDD